MQPPPSNQSCDNCYFGRIVLKNIGGEATIPKCCRKPPPQPAVDPTDWCGKWSATLITPTN